MIEKLKLNKEFRRLYGRGKSFVHRAYIGYILPDRSGRLRFGITAGKKLGSAVIRNRAKRLISAAVREVSPEISGGWQMVFVARSNIFKYKSYEIAERIRRDLAAAGACEGKNE